MSKSCTSTINGNLKQFSCNLSEECCGVECCDPNIRFYKHWYFLLFLTAFVLFMIGAIISRYCRRKDPPHTRLHSESGHEQQDNDSCQSSLKQIQIVHTSRPFMYSYRDQEAV